MHRRIQVVKSAAESQLNQRLDIERLAGLVNLSASHLRNLFKKEMGLTLDQYVKNCG